MTENQWSDTPAPAAPTAGTGGFGATTEYVPGATPLGDVTGTSRKDAAKDEATDVARTAADSAQNVAQTAKEEVAHVASEAKSSAKDLMNQAKSGLTSQAGTQQQKAAEGIRNISTQLHSMAEAPGEQGIATDLIREAAERTSSIAGWLENRDPGSLLSEVQTFARNKPGTFLLLAAGAGILAGRLTRGLTAGAPETSANGGQALGSTPYPPVADGTTPPPPVHLPGPAVATAGFDGGAPGSNYPSAGSASSLDSPQLVEEPWTGNRLDDESFATDPLTGDPVTRDPSDGQSGRF
ncbi:hypothetical protein ACRB8A_02360 [Arthrobacter sp. G.S.26]|uniref:hypothetical protein n=1 Tax=Arthrobacter sp. G.S.26 TaxID=3433706 RepID=UPI003D7783D6